MNIRFFCQSKQRGFTLIEVLVSMGVLSIISGIAITIFVTVSSSYDKANVIKTLNSEGNQVMERVTRAVRSATGATQVSPSRLRLEIPRESDNLEYSNNGECTQIEIFKDGTNIKKQAINSSCDDLGNAPCTESAPCLLTNDNVEVTDLVFGVTVNNNGPEHIKINLSLRQDPSLSNPDPQQQASVDFESTVLTRGY